jgi:peptide-methionine (R)-S-oxide reductase
MTPDIAPAPPCPNRRHFLAAASAGAAIGAAMGAAPHGLRAQPVGSEAPYAYEVTRSIPAWRKRLTDEEFAILRLRQTETPYSSTLWNEIRTGTYCCRGCDLTLYDSDWKVPVDKGWVFFRHARPDSVLMAIDNGWRPDPAMQASTEIEAHCRRCGSHLGHIVRIGGGILHCINGKALSFTAAA